jgi:hypothetical protein
MVCGNYPVAPATSRIIPLSAQRYNSTALFFRLQELISVFFTILGHFVQKPEKKPRQQPAAAYYDVRLTR